MKVSNDLLLIVYVPTEFAEKIRSALGKSGAGQIGNYSFCSFSTKGVGRFLAGEHSNPAIGEKGQLETIEEERIEVTLPSSKLKKIIGAVKKSPPL